MPRAYPEIQKGVAEAVAALNNRIFTVKEWEGFLCLLREGISNGDTLCYPPVGTDSDSQAFYDLCKHFSIHGLSVGDPMVARCCTIKALDKVMRLNHPRKYPNIPESCKAVFLEWAYDHFVAARQHSELFFQAVSASWFVLETLKLELGTLVMPRLRIIAECFKHISRDGLEDIGENKHRFCLPFAMENLVSVLRLRIKSHNMKFIENPATALSDCVSSWPAELFDKPWPRDLRDYPSDLCADLDMLWRFTGFHYTGSPWFITVSGRERKNAEGAAAVLRAWLSGGTHADSDEVWTPPAKECWIISWLREYDYAWLGRSLTYGDVRYILHYMEDKLAKK